jgi:hypothetical protein
VTLASIRYLRAWEVNRDGTIAGLAATAIDLDEHAPTRMKFIPAATTSDRTRDELILYGELAHKNLFSPSRAYALEIWGNVRITGPCGAAGGPTTVTNLWSYCVVPFARPNYPEHTVDEHTVEYRYPKYTDGDGVTYDAERFDLIEGNAWGAGPHPIRFVDHDGELRPAYLDPPLGATDLWRAQTTTMAPLAALQYTDHARATKDADA